MCEWVCVGQVEGWYSSLPLRPFQSRNPGRNRRSLSRCGLPRLSPSPSLDLSSALSI